MLRFVVCLLFVVGIATQAVSQSYIFTGGILAAPWNPVSVSADGSHIYVPTFPDSILGSPPGYYHSSYDTGKTWTKQLGSGNRFWIYGCTSSDGTIVYGSDQSPGFIYKSTDSGVTWNATNSLSLPWQEVSCSSDGTKLVACVGSQSTFADIYTSIDGGATWVDQTATLPRSYITCVMSGDGTKIATSNWLGQNANSDGKVYISTNWQSGSPTWTGSNAAANGASFATLAYSRDGSTLYAVYNSNGSTSHIFKTINDGGLWTDVNPPGGTGAQRGWATVACSANGNVIIAANSSKLAVSADAGATWSQQSFSPIGPNGPLQSQNAFFGVSDNGKIIVSAVYNGFVSVSLDSGATWRMTSATGP